MAFCLKPSSISPPIFGLEHNSLLRKPIWISRTTHFSKSGLCHPEILKFNKGACQEIGLLGWRNKPSLTRTAAFRSSEGKNKMKVFEQEGLVDGDGDLKFRAANGGLEATLNRLSKWLVSFTFGAIVVLRHDPEAMWLLSGSVINSTLSTILKRILNQDRPVTTLKSDPGMPSSHAQSIFFVAAYLTVSTLGSLGVNALTLVLGSIIFAFASYLSWLRVSQQCHTVSQVLVGAILGSSFSFFWLWTWNAVIHEAYISYLLVRVCVVLGAAGFSIAFGLLYVTRHWLKDDS